MTRDRTLHRLDQAVKALHTHAMQIDDGLRAVTATIRPDRPSRPKVRISTTQISDPTGAAILDVDDYLAAINRKLRDLIVDLSDIALRCIGDEPHVAPCKHRTRAPLPGTGPTQQDTPRGACEACTILSLANDIQDGFHELWRDGAEPVVLDGLLWSTIDCQRTAGQIVARLRAWTHPNWSHPDAGRAPRTCSHEGCDEPTDGRAECGKHRVQKSRAKKRAG